MVTAENGTEKDSASRKTFSGAVRGNTERSWEKKAWDLGANKGGRRAATGRNNKVHLLFHRGREII